ncbi:ROK family transcriptional regulator [Planosporangium flavigriseum]|uniref:Sugar kinase n=1 Tax=Planosporangium flavigriseum TaxID=373681 RepID=A0A8J3M023_9ACTN|nr:ROK family transcriptional regulator [Planosporangium flavigriseum]NJC67962.1 ROK family transcriptional regulator [Planosporangium flavigriseum]GIG76570.1 sugar kinase [Planosporangium flavigriseum]
MDRRSWLPEDVRAHNRGLLLRLLTEQGPLSRRELAGRTGLSIPTVSSIVTDLTSEGYLTESIPRTYRPARRGPRASVVTLSRHGYMFLGVDIRTDEVRLGLTDLSGLVTRAARAPFERGAPAERVIDIAVAAATDIVEAAARTMVAIGVGVPGPVDPARRRCVLSLALGWRDDIDVADRFERALDKPTVVDYNVRAMAVAEARYGLGQRAENLLYVHIGEGVGFGFVVDGKPFRQGAHGVSELGHHQVSDDGPRCRCGSIGCLEAVLSESYLRSRVEQGARRSPVLARARRQHRGVLDILDAARRAGDEIADDLLAEFTDHLSTTIALNVNVFSPTRVALGGILATAPKEVLNRALSATRTKICSVLRDKVTVEPSTLGQHAGLLGAATVALDHVFYERGAVPVQV